MRDEQNVTWFLGFLRVYASEKILLRQAEYLVLLADQPLEKKEYERLLRKEAVAQDLPGDVVEPPMNRQIMLDEVLQELKLFSDRDMS